MTPASRITAATAFAVAIALAAVVLLLTTPWTVNPSSGSDVIQGDVDCDKDVDSVDALFGLKFVAGIGPFGDCTEEAGDTDCSGSIGAVDSLHILRFVGGFDSTTPEDCTQIGTSLGEPPTPTGPGSPGPTDTPGASPSPGETATSTPSPGPTVTPTPGPTPTPVTYALTRVLDAADYDSMIDFDVIPGTNGEEAVVITQGGELWRISLTEAFAPTAFGDVSALVNCCGEEGLLSIAFPPDFTEDERVYLYYTRDDTPGSVCADSTDQCSFISHFAVTGNVMNTAPTVVMEIAQPFGNHNGGRLLFGTDGFLYLGLGDGGGDAVENGQDTTTVLGSIIRIDPQPLGGYTIPDGNPFADGTGGDADEIWAYGLRNPWRMSFDSATGDLWVGDVGEDDWEEVDLIEPGKNYGWVCYEGPDPENLAGCPGPGAFEFPRAAYGRPSDDCAIVGGYVYRGTEMPELQGWYIFGDFCSGLIRGYDTATSDPPVVLIESG
ncbi:MAG: PQQ-dependent sugar dehydrogenase, partial [Dehalococcoidia bacterium]